MEAVSDVRKDFIITTAGNYFQLKLSDTIYSETTDNPILNSFLDSINVPSIVVSSNGDKLEFENKDMKMMESRIAKIKNILIFFKIGEKPITEENYNKNIYVTTMMESPIKSLYYTIQSVYVPLISQENHNRSDAFLLKNLKDLEWNLRSLLNKHNSNETQTNEGVFTLDDEILYWAHAKKVNDYKISPEIRKKILESLKQLDSNVRSLSFSFNLEVKELLEQIFNGLDDIWKFEDIKYSEERMKNLMNIIGNEIVLRIQNEFIDKNLFALIQTERDCPLNEPIQLCMNWKSICSKLTNVYWPNYTIHPWTSGKFIPQFIAGFCKRLNEVKEVSLLRAQLSTLFEMNEETVFFSETYYDPFKDIKPLHYNYFSEPSWKAALNLFNKGLKKVEESGASVLQQMCILIEPSHTIEILSLIVKFSSLFQRPTIQDELKPYLENFLQVLQTYVTNLRPNDDVKSKNVLDTTQIVKNVYHSREQLSKLEDVISIPSGVFKHLQGHQEYVENLASVKTELKEFADTQFATWTEQILSEISRGSFRIETEESVVYFNQGKLMVNVSPKITTLVRETRQLTSLGLPVAHEIMVHSTKVKHYMDQAKALNHIATFHNTIGDKMINSQRAMMLSSAREFARLIDTQNVTWAKGKQVDDYIKKLKGAASRLLAENNILTKNHAKIMSKIIDLLEVDLVKGDQIWKNSLKYIRQLVAEVEEQFSSTNHWRNHVDYQIYKALEHQYQMCLSNIDEALPEFHLEILYLNHKIEYRPNLNSMRREFYKTLTNLLSIPLLTQGVGDTNIFPAIIEHNAHRFDRVFMQAEANFKQLEDFTKIWYKWVALSEENFDAYIEKYLLEPDDWTRNHKASKFFGLQVSKLPSMKRIGSFCVSLDGLRSSIEIQNKRYYGSLIVCLKSSIWKDVLMIEAFQARAQIALQHQPQKVEEITEAHFNYQQIYTESKQITIKLEELDEKYHMLRSWINESISAVLDIKRSWANFQVLIENYNVIISKQAETLKSSLYSEYDVLQQEIERFTLRWQEMKPNENKLLEPEVSEHYFVENLKFIRDRKKEWTHIMDRKLKMKEDFLKLGMEQPQNEDYNFEAVEEEIIYSEKMWSTMEEFKVGIEKLGEEEWIIIRSKAYAKVDLYLEEWLKKLKELPSSPITTKILQNIDQYKELIPYLQYVRGETFSEKHWIEVFNVLNMPSKPVEQILLSDFLFCGQNISQNISILKDINSNAAAEIVIRQGLSELDTWETEAQFNIYSHTDSKSNNVNLIKDFRTVMDKVGDNQSLLQSIKGSSNISQFSDRIRLWEEKLTKLDIYLCDLNQVQRKWAYLEPIFGSGALEETRFERIDKEWRYILQQLSLAHFRVVALTRINNISNTLQQLLQNLLHCQKTLQNYLEDKRLKFPRFYFLNDDDLLEILGQASKPNVIQTHLKKIFTGIHSVEIEEQSITNIYSAQGEHVQLNAPIQITSNIEEWLEQLSVEVHKTLKRLVINCLKEPDPLKYPCQVLCLAERVNFTRNCEQAIVSSSLPKVHSELKSQREEYVKQLMEWCGTESNKESEISQLKLKALLLDTIYYLSVVESLINANVTGLDQWNWKKILRFYCTKENDIVVKMVDAQFNYSYEYQGIQPKLVNTALTDKCFLTLTQALDLGFGGNPYGPAGTGKTESVKALGALLGRQVLVFNCDESLDVNSLTRIMVGLIKCGAWGCFDEFNRLEETTLSLISLQIHIMQEALIGRSQTVVLLDTTVEVNHNCGIFITLNPAGKGYGGRQKLPENLKQLFIPVLMSKPDDIEIAKVILLCEGFQQAEEIGFKLVTLFMLASKLLSQQQHYDWGLRALKTVVGSCGAALRNYLSYQQTADPKVEMELVIQAVRLNTLCKLTFTDSARFEQLIKDVFKDVKLTASGFKDIEDAISESCAHLKLTYNERQARKCIELYEQLQQRMGVVVIGPSGSGKSSIITILKSALTKMGSVVRHHIVNPKSMPRHQLLGQIDQDTRQWTDGVLTAIAQDVYNEPQNVDCWVHCDGDVDPEWIESLNSVLDDNHLLTLPSGWRIQFGDNVHFIFETHNLSYASPATVSRMGIILLSENDLDVNTLIESWITQQEEGSLAVEYVQEYFYKIIAWLKDNGRFMVDVNLNSAIVSCLKTFSNLTSKTHFCVSVINGCSSNLTSDCKEKFIQMVLDLTKEFIFDTNSGNYIFYDKESDSLKEYKTTIEYPNKPLNFVFTPYMCTARDTILTWLNFNEPVIVVGPSGSGKSTLLNICFSEMHNIEVVSIDCSAYVSPSHIIQKLNQVCVVVSSNSRRLYRPKNADKVVLHFSDINVALSDKYGTKILVEFLKQATNYRGFFNSNLEWMGIENIIFTYSVNTIGDLSPRFLSLNQVFYLRSPNVIELHDIYGSLMKRDFESSSHCSIIVAAIIEIYENVQKTFTNSCHAYNFSQRDISKWLTNLLRYEDNNLVEAFVFEAQRLIGDKLFEDDKKKFDNLLKLEVKNSFDADVTNLNLNEMYFVFNKQNSQEKLGGNLIQMNSQDWIEAVKHASIQIEGDNLNESIVLTPDLMRLAAKLECALTEAGGNVLLAAKAGAGRKSSLQIIAERQKSTIFSPKLGENYNLTNFQNDMKMVMQLSGINDEQVYLLIEDHQILNDEYLNMINSLVSSGEILGLYQPEELDNVTSPLKAMDIDINFDNKSVLNYFCERIAKNVHIILCFNYDDMEFIQKLKSNPAIIKSCYQIWIEQFSKETMFAIPYELLNREKLEGETGRNEENIKLLIDCMSSIHSSAEMLVKAPPLFYFNLISMYMNLKREKQVTLIERQQSLQAGVSKITDAKNVVAKLKADASEQKILLDEKQAKGKQVLDQISETMANAGLQRNDIEQLRQQTEQENKNLQIRKAEIDKELASIEPLLKEAQAAVGNIRNEALSEIRSLRAPPIIIRDILEGVLRLMGIQDTSWNSMKTFLAKRGVKEEIRVFDARVITEENRDAVDQLLLNNNASFDSKNAKRASVAAAPLAAWVKANVQFSKVLQKIYPLEQEQGKLKRNLELAELQIEELGSGLNNVDAIVAKLKDQLGSSTKEAAEIEVHLNKVQSTIVAAEGLVTKLNDEFKIWIKQLSELSSTLEVLTPNCLLAAAFITYLSGAPKILRCKLISDWKAIVNYNGEFSITECLSTEREMLQWSSEGLPNDEFSRQNAIIIINSMLSPLILDPSSIASNWLKNHFSSETVEILTQHSSTFFSKLELAVRFGKILIVEDIEHIHPILEPLLRKNFVHQGPRKMIYLGQKLIDYHTNFKLFLTSRSLGLETSKMLRTAFPILNYGATTEGLTQQLLGCALKVEKPLLEKRRVELLQEEEQFKSKLYFLQEKVLQELAHSQGDILKNKDLLSSLKDTKESSAAIMKSLEESTEIKNEMTKEYEVYKPLSEYGSKIFFACASLSNINNMYHISVSTFLKLFEKSVASSQHDDTIAQKCNELLTTVYNYISRSLFKADRLAFALHLVHMTMPELFQTNEWEVFIDQNVSGIQLDVSKDTKETFPYWIENDRVRQVSILQSQLPEFYNELQLQNETLWVEFMTSSSPKCPNHCKLTKFQFILILQALRPDTLHSNLITFVLGSLGLASLSPMTLQLNDLLMESTATEPILIITSPGNDPSQELLALAASKTSYFKELVVGPGQEKNILKSLEDASRQGKWIILKNLHLLTSWLPTLVKTVQDLKPEPNFRLWMITESHSNFSPILLSSSLKITYEAPPGVKRNLEKTYNEWNTNKSLEPTIRGAQTMFILAWFHAILQERRTYIPQGWTSFYEFNDTDLSVATTVIKKRLQDKNTTDHWDFIHGLFELTIYGGRVNNVYDLRVISTYLLSLFNSDMIRINGSPIASGIHIPSSSDIKEHLSIIKKLPEKDKPEYFGLPQNVARIWQRVTSSNTIGQLKELNKNIVAGDTVGMKSYSACLTPLVKLWKQLNQGVGLIFAELPALAADDEPIIVFFNSELAFAVDLISKIHTTLVDLKQIIKVGFFSNKGKLDIANSILLDQVPEEWDNIWSGPKTPADYIKTVISKAIKIQNMQQNIESVRHEPINLNDLYNVETFLMVLRQQAARCKKQSIEKVQLFTKWGKLTADLLEGSVSIVGVLLEGAMMRDYTLSHTLEGSPSVEQAPPFVLSWQTHDDDPKTIAGIVIPLYASETREKLITELFITCVEKEKVEWIKAGVAFYIFNKM